jgi:hypothetical protein
MDLQAAVVSDPVIGRVVYLRLVKGGADELAVFKKREGKCHITADPVLMKIDRVAFDIIILIHIQSSGINPCILPLQQTDTRAGAQQVSEIEPEYRVVLGLCKGFESQQLMDFIIVAEMLVAGIHKIRFACLDEIDIIEQDKAVPVFLVLNAKRVGERQDLLRILNDRKTKIRISYPAVGIIQEALAFDINDLRNG